MKKLLSIWSGRLVFLLVPAALIASFLAPANVLAIKEISLGGGIAGYTEGDPLDTNDFGSSGGSGGSDVQDQNGTDPISNPFVFELDRIQIVLIPEFVGGTLIFKIMVIDKAALGMTDFSLEGTHAP